MELALHNGTGGAAGALEVSDKAFASDYNETLVHQAVVAYMAGARAGSKAQKSRAEVRGGHFHFIPKGVEHWLYNLSDAEALEVVGVYIDAGNVAATGYVYMGDVGEADIHAPRTDR